MLVHPIVDKLQSLRFFGMRCAFEEQMQTADIDQLNFEERMGLLVDREMTERDNRRREKGSGHSKWLIIQKKR